MYSNQDSKNNTKISALWSIFVRYAKAYVNQFLALPNAVYSHNVYLYWKSIRDEGNIGKCTGGVKGWEEMRRR